jgi:hypothetical protein
VSGYDRVQRTAPWIIVAVFLAGAVLVALGIIVGGLFLALLGAVSVVVAALCAVVLPRFGLSAPLSYNAEFPDTAARGDPQATDDSHEEQPYEELPEIPARKLPEGPDKERAKPQYVNLAPHERLRAVRGEEVIEIPGDDHAE